MDLDLYNQNLILGIVENNKKPIERDCILLDRNYSGKKFFLNTIILFCF